MRTWASHLAGPFSIGSELEFFFEMGPDTYMKAGRENTWNVYQQVGGFGCLYRKMFSLVVSQLLSCEQALYLRVLGGERGSIWIV